MRERAASPATVDGASQALFAITLFLGAALLFLVEPMIARMLLPLLGGAPAVWITCMLFFQAALLAGYAYARFATVLLGPRAQVVLHLALFAVAALALPIGFDGRATAAWPADQNPSLRLLGLLTVGVGAPCLVIATGAPLLQTWFSRIGHRDGDDPYYLYAASNLGSLLALAAYPLLVEPRLGLAAQSRLWQRGYLVLLGLVALCAIVYARRAQPVAVIRSDKRPRERVTGWRRVRWVAYAFVPSCYLLAVTTFVTTDVAAIPLFLVVPLALYLVTFVLAFSRRQLVPHTALVRALPMAVTVVLLVMLVEVAQPLWLIVSLHLGLFFLASLLCHGALARDRPDAAGLADYYLWISVGGVLGGVFVSLIAPLAFRHLVEYPLAIVLACACRLAPGWRGDEARERRRDLAVPALIGLGTTALLVAGRTVGVHPSARTAALLFGAPLLLNYATLHRPLRFALGVAAILVARPLYDGTVGRELHVERGFFGVVRVSRDDGGRFVQIVSGDTLHGRQHLEAARRDEPTLYYHPSGPIGDVFAHHRSVTHGGRVAVLGLGAGELAAYALPDEEWTFFEIDPTVARVARDPRWFNFLTDAFPGEHHLRIELGDGRLAIARAANATFDLLVLDAFSSDAIPMHLLTREAIVAYIAHLAPRALLAIHVSNHYVDLHGVLADLARDAGLVAWARDDHDLDERAWRDGKVPSDWVVLARRDEDLGAIARDPRWHRLVGDATRRLWTDDFANLVSVYKW